LLSKGIIIDSIYRIERTLGKGSQGTVFHVKTTDTGSDMALKMINFSNDDKSRFSDILEMIRSEFKIIKSLHHKNIIGVNNFGYDKQLDRYYYTMDLLEGLNLRDYFAVNSTISKFPFIVYQILEGLNYLHSNNIIHFDIKPDNIFITNIESEPEVKILDFGLSEIKKQNKQNADVKGTITYIAPEFIIDPTKISPKTDLYSLGITLIRAIKNLKSKSTGVRIGKDSLIKAINGEYDKNIQLLSSIEDNKIRSFISQLTEKNPGIRISSAVEAIISLNKIFNLDFKTPAVNHISSFLNNPKFVLRENIYNRVMRLREEAVKKGTGRSILITGHSGTGKSKLLNQIELEVALKVENVIKMYLDDNTSEDFFIGKLLLFKTYNFYKDEPGIAKEYEKISADLDSITENAQDISYVFDDLIKFIFLCSETGNNILTLLFDNYERYDRESARFVTRLFNINKKKGNLCVIISVSDSIMNEAEALRFELIGADTDIPKIDLPLLTYKETKEAIDIFLGNISNLPSDFVKQIYDHTGGNFRKLMIYFDEFFKKGVLSYISGILIFRDQEKFKGILKSVKGRSVFYLIEGLDKIELRILKLLSLTFNKLTFEEIRKSTGFSEYDINRGINKLINQDMIGGYDNLYKAVRSEVKNYVLAKTVKKELTDLYIRITDMDHSDRFSRNAYEFIRIILSPNKTPSPEPVDKIISQLEKSDSNDNLYYLFLNSIRLISDSGLKFRIKVNFARFLFGKNTDQAVKLIKKLDAEYFKKEIDIPNRISFIRLKLKMPEYCKLNYDAFLFAVKAVPVMEKGMRPEEIYDLMIEFVKSLLQSGENFKSGVKIIDLLERKFAGDKNISFEYPNLLNTVKLVYGVIEWKEEYEKLLANYISEHVKAKLFNSSYFYLLQATSLLVEKHFLKGFYEERLNFGLETAYRLKDFDYVFTMYSALIRYYFFKKDMEKALFWLEKKVEVKQQVRKELSTDDISDIATLRATLYYPLGEVIELAHEATRQAREKNNLHDYGFFLANEFVLLHRKGDFKNAKKALKKSFLFFGSFPEILQLWEYDRVGSYFPEILTKDEAESDLNDLLSDKSVSQEAHNKMKGMLEKFYKYGIYYRWSPDRIDEILAGSLCLETPMMLLHYLKRNRKLPEVNIVMGTIDHRFYKPEYAGDHLSFLVTEFMMTGDVKLIDTIFEISRKLHISGYVMINIYTIIPFMEYALMVKIPKDRLSKFIDFYQEIKSYLFDNMDEDQKILSESTYFFRRGKKIMEYFDRL